MKLSCPATQKMGDILKFGLARKDQFVKGHGLTLDINLYKRCQIGTMPDIRREYIILQEFQKNCIGKNSCEWPINIEQKFGIECAVDMLGRSTGKLENLEHGPPRIYAIVQCNHDQFVDEYNREHISYMVVVLDMAIVLLFTLAIFRLKYYEKLSDIDMKHG